MGLSIGVFFIYVSFLVRSTTVFCFHQVFGEGLKLGYSLKMMDKFQDFKTFGKVR
jgi:hypothetical protein